MAAQNKPTLVVFGATGAQGGSVARYAAQTGDFGTIRLVTRNAGSDSAKAILNETTQLAKGQTQIQVVQGTFDDKASLDAALAGAQYSFAVTNWWELFFANGAVPGEAGFAVGRKAGEIELTQGKNWVDAVKKANLTFSVYSGLEDAAATSEYKNVYHYNYKGQIENYLWQNVAGASVRYPAYLENFASMMKPQPDGTLAIPFGEGLFPTISVAEAGSAVAGLFSQVIKYGPAYWDKQAIGLASDAVKLSDLAAIWSKVSGKKVNFVNVPPAAYAKFGFPGDAELAEMFQFQADPRLCWRDPVATKALATTRLSTVAEWFEANKAKFQ